MSFGLPESVFWVAVAVAGVVGVALGLYTGLRDRGRWKRKPRKARKTKANGPAPVEPQHRTATPVAAATVASADTALPSLESTSWERASLLPVGVWLYSAASASEFYLRVNRAPDQDIIVVERISRPEFVDAGARGEAHVDVLTLTPGRPEVTVQVYKVAARIEGNGDVVLDSAVVAIAQLDHPLPAATLSQKEAERFDRLLSRAVNIG